MADSTTTVGKLIEALNQFPKDYLVILSKDAEGNNFSPLCPQYSEETSDFLSWGMYEPESTYSGSFHAGQEDYDDYANYNNEDDYESDYEENAVCLWPTN